MEARNTIQHRNICNSADICTSRIEILHSGIIRDEQGNNIGPGLETRLAARASPSAHIVMSVMRCWHCYHYTYTAIAVTKSGNSKCNTLQIMFLLIHFQLCYCFIHSHKYLFTFIHPPKILFSQSQMKWSQPVSIRLSHRKIISTILHHLSYRNTRTQFSTTWT